MTQPQFITDAKGNFYLAFQTDLVSGYLPVPIPKVDPRLRWHGPKIPLGAWYEATTFMADFMKHEVVLRFFVEADKSKITIRPYTQVYGTGMSVKETPTKEDYDEIAGLGLTDIGTVHSHCNMKAFASGIDTNDEKNWPGGLHLTVGNLDEKQYDLHARMAWDIPGIEQDMVVVRKAQRTLQAPDLSDWFELPLKANEFIEQEPELSESILLYLLCKPVTAQYPAWWPSKLIAPPPPQKPSAYYPGPGGWQPGMLDNPEMMDPDFFRAQEPAKPGRKKKQP